MKIISLNVGMRGKYCGMEKCDDRDFQGTGAGGALRKLNLDGDRQADLTVHEASTKRFTAIR